MVAMLPPYLPAQPWTDRQRTKVWWNAYLKETEKKPHRVSYTVTLSNRTSGINLHGTRGFAPIYVSICQSKAAGWCQHGLSTLTDLTRTLESDVRIKTGQTIFPVLPQQNWVDRKYFFSIRFSRPFTQTRQTATQSLERRPSYILQFDWLIGHITNERSATDREHRRAKTNMQHQSLYLVVAAQKGNGTLPERWIGHRSCAVLYHGSSSSSTFGRISRRWIKPNTGGGWFREKPGMELLFHMGYLSMRRIAIYADRPAESEQFINSMIEHNKAWLVYRSGQPEAGQLLYDR